MKMGVNELGFTESYLKIFWNSKAIWDLFQDFMHGQTVSIIEGETTYYFLDVQNFCTRYYVTYPRKIEPILWVGEDADSTQLESFGTRTGLVNDGLLKGKTITIDTAKYDCGAYSMEVTISDTFGKYRNQMQGCWQQQHQRDSSVTFANEVVEELCRLEVII
jgi:hypothetical protein